MEIRNLSLLHAISRLGSLTKAADALGVTQPKASRMIRRLEAEMGVALLDRMRRPAHPTVLGFELLRRTDQLLKELEGFVSSFHSENDGAIIRIASPRSLIRSFILPAIRAYQNRSHRDSFEIQSGTNTEIVQMLRDRVVDVGIVSDCDLPAGLETESLFEFGRSLIAPLGHPVLRSPIKSLADFAQYPLILQKPATNFRTHLESELKRLRIPYQIVVDVDGVDIVKELVEVGIGISVVPTMAIQPADQDKLGVVKLDHLFSKSTIWLVRRPAQDGSPPNQFLSVLRQQEV